MVVMDALHDFAATMDQMGFTLSEKLYLEELEMINFRIQPPVSMSLAPAQEKIKGFFPGIIVANTDVEMTSSAAVIENSSF